MSTLFNLSGKKAIITGSSRGIGKAIAFRMAEHGAKVIITSRKLNACEEISSEINEKFGIKEGWMVIRCLHLNRTKLFRLNLCFELIQEQFLELD